MATTQLDGDSAELKGISRRKLIKFAGLMATTLALPASYTTRIARAVAAAPRLPVVWLSFQECTGDTESFLRANDPTVVDLIFNKVSLDFHETLMVAAGRRADEVLADTIARYPGQFICVVEGGIPTRDGGIHCVIGGRTALSIATETCRQARVNIALGSCAWDGGIQAAAPNPTGSVGLGTAVPGVPNLINMPGCPANGVNLVAAIVHFLTFGSLPALDSRRRPLFAYGSEIHDEGHCERYPFYEADLYVRAWGDAGHRQGYCLKGMGCKGPETSHNCYRRNWNSNTSWPIGTGAICIGCTSSRFWDKQTPFYRDND